MSQNQNIGQEQKEVVKVEDVLWLFDHVLNKEKKNDITGQLVDKAINIVVEEMKKAVQERMPKYKVDYVTLLEGMV